MERPTKEDYEKVQKDILTYKSWIQLSREKQTELIDALCAERSSEKTYMEALEHCKEIKTAYEIWENLENKK